MLMSPVLCWSYPGIQSYSDFMSATVITHPEDAFFQSIFLSSRSSFSSSPSVIFPECLSYFSTALIKYHDQGKLIEWLMYWPYCSGGMSPSPTHQINVAAEPGSPHLKLQAGKESQLGMEGDFHAQSSPSMTLHSARSHPLNYQIVPFGDHIFKCLRLWRTTHLNHHIGQDKSKHLTPISLIMKITQIKLDPVRQEDGMPLGIQCSWLC